MAQDPTPEKTEDRLVIQFVFEHLDWRFRWWPFHKQPHPVRGIPLRYGIRVQNVGNKAFPGATVSNFYIGSRAADLATYSTNEPAIPSLNPGESKTLWLESGILSMEGNVWVSCDLAPHDPLREIVAFQAGSLQAGSPESVRGARRNSWRDSEYVEQKLALLQTRTNNLICLLTALIFMDAVLGLNYIAGQFLKLCRSILLWLAGLLG